MPRQIDLFPCFISHRQLKYFLLFHKILPSSLLGVRVSFSTPPPIKPAPPLTAKPYKADENEEHYQLLGLNSNELRAK